MFIHVQDPLNIPITRIADEVLDAVRRFLPLGRGFGHSRSPGAVPDPPSRTHSPTVVALQPGMRRLWRHSG